MTNEEFLNQSKQALTLYFKEIGIDVPKHTDLHDAGIFTMPFMLNKINRKALIIMSYMALGDDNGFIVFDVYFGLASGEKIKKAIQSYNSSVGEGDFKARLSDDNKLSLGVYGGHFYKDIKELIIFIDECLKKTVALNHADNSALKELALLSTDYIN